MDLTRKQVIEILEKHHMWTGEPQEVVDVRLENVALDYAISSLKTDEAYQLMYEGGEIFTKDEVIGMFKDLQVEIEEKGIDLCDDGWHHTYSDIIQQKIDKLRGM